MVLKMTNKIQYEQKLQHYRYSEMCGSDILNYWYKNFNEDYSNIKTKSIN